MRGRPEDQAKDADGADHITEAPQTQRRHFRILPPGDEKHHAGAGRREASHDDQSRHIKMHDPNSHQELQFARPRVSSGWDVSVRDRCTCRYRCRRQKNCIRVRYNCSELRCQPRRPRRSGLELFELLRVRFRLVPEWIRGTRRGHSVPRRPVVRQSGAGSHGAKATLRWNPCYATRSSTLPSARRPWARYWPIFSISGASETA